MKFKAFVSILLLGVLTLIALAGCAHVTNPLAVDSIDVREADTPETMALSATASKFMLAVMPDTQSEVCVGPGNTPTKFFAMTRWLTNIRSASNLQFVITVGDNINWTTPDEYMWKNLSNGYRDLDIAGMNYALALGNHDTHAVATNGGSARPGDTHALLRETPEFNRYFPVSRFKAQKGRYQTGKSDNAFYTFTAGGLNWLVLSLELWARQGAVDWAKTVLANPAYTNHNVIITMHSYLNSDGSIYSGNGGYGDMTSRAIYDQLVSQYANVRMVVCGHVGSSAHRTDVGAKGNTVYQILQDYQGENNGWVRLIEVDTSAKTMKFWMYSPYLKQGRSDSSTFSFSGVNFVPTGVPATPPVVSGAPANLTTNKAFSITLDVDKNYGYWSTNGSSFSPFTTAGVSVPISRTTTLRYYGKEGTGISGTTNSRTYTFDTAAPVVSGAPANLTTNASFSITLDVNENYGYWSTNGSAFSQFTTSGVTISIADDTTLRCYGKDALGNTSATNTRTYSIDTAVYYKIKNRHLTNQFLCDGGDRVTYGSGSTDAYRWTLEYVGNGIFRLKNKSSGKYMHVDGGLDYVELGTPAASDTKSQWFLVEMGDYWREIRNQYIEKSVASNTSRIHTDHQKGYAEYLNASYGWWTAQWFFVRQ
ncbi:MAG: RICIN domain-containing protein [Spirochaetes bacterium]|nr:RICIN domain-containing protein [Spirochaetota bacterium]